MYTGSHISCENAPVHDLKLKLFVSTLKNDAYCV